ncbi:MAG: hypothetical protein U0640_13615 [Phycisphaerales bacterium]
MARGGTNYIPRPDGDFSAWANNYNEAVHKFYEAQGLDVSELKPLETALAEWQKDYPAHVTAQQKAEGARAAKDVARAALEKEVRPITNFVQGYTKTTDADRATIGITVRDTSKTPSPTPTSAPVVQVESGQRLTHRIRFIDGGAGGHGAHAARRGGKPPGTIGAEVWLALTPTGQPAPPLNSPGQGGSDSYKFLSVSSRGNLQTDFPSAEAGKTAYYALRWVSTRGEKGPWSEVAAATVAA